MPWDIALDDDRAPPPKGALQPPTFRPMFIVPKRLDTQYNYRLCRGSNAVGLCKLILFKLTAISAHRGSHFTSLHGGHCAKILCCKFTELHF